MKNLAVYIHWPFCAQKCPYCDFNSHVRDRIDQAAWARAYLAELDYYRNLIGPRRVTSIFFGGGTPSLMNPDIVGSVIKKISDIWMLGDEAEITLEANPNSVEIDKFRSFKSNGINRVSIGIQSLDDKQLKFLGRVHNTSEGIRAIETARTVFDRYSFDLIYARPKQTVQEWETELAQALTYAGGHLSLYQLTIEPQTPFFTAHARGEFSVPGEDEAAELYVLTDQIMAAAGLPAYEISNYAKPGQESRHNLAYWHYDDYVGVGPGAHGRLTLNGIKYATRAHRAPEIWLERVGQNGHGAHPFTLVPLAGRGVEALMMGLRLNVGFDFDKMTTETGQDWSKATSPDRIQKLVESGDLVWVSNKKIAPTLAGRLRLNQVISYLLGA